jgi:hypothetical protein
MLEGVAAEELGSTVWRDTDADSSVPAVAELPDGIPAFALLAAGVVLTVVS